jgi:hypothetical protein
LFALVADLTAFAEPSVGSAPSNTGVGSTDVVKETSEQVNQVRETSRTPLVSYPTPLKVDSRPAFKANPFARLRLVNVRDGSVAAFSSYSLGSFDGMRGYSPFYVLGSGKNSSR